MHRSAIALASLVAFAGLMACARKADTDDELDRPALVHDARGVPRLLVYVDRDGVTTIAGEAILDDATIVERAEAFRGKHPTGEVALACHAAALHGRAVRVVELLAEAKIAPVAVDVTPDPSRRSAR